MNNTMEDRFINPTLHEESEYHSESVTFWGTLTKK